MVLGWILGSTLLVSLISLIGILFLIIHKRLLDRILLGLVAFGAGGLMGGAFFHLMPEALEEMDALVASVILIAGFSLFYLIETLIWDHCHSSECPIHPFSYLNILGDGLHNLIDGIVIAAAYLASIPLGIVATVAVATHEIPQEFGDFGILVYGGFTPYKALALNFLTAITAIGGALITYFLLIDLPEFIPFILPFAAGNFLYIASSDLIPELHVTRDKHFPITTFLIFLSGLLVMLLLKIAFEA